MDFERVSVLLRCSATIHRGSPIGLPNTCLGQGPNPWLADFLRFDTKFLLSAPDGCPAMAMSVGGGFDLGLGHAAVLQQLGQESFGFGLGGFFLGVQQLASGAR